MKSRRPYRSLLIILLIVSNGYVSYSQEETKKSLAYTLSESLGTEDVLESWILFEEKKNASTYYADKGEFRQEAYGFMNANRSDLGLELLKMSAALYPGANDIYNEYSICNAAEQLHRGGNKELAADYLKFNDVVNPGSTTTYSSIASNHMHDGDMEAAVTNYIKATKLNPRDNLFQIVFREEEAYKPTEIPSDTSEIFEYRGDLSADTAFIYVQGGPSLELNINSTDILHQLPNADQYLKVYPLQALVLNPKAVTKNPHLSEAEAQYEHGVNAEILHRTITYLKNQGKTVYVIGHSYGAAIGWEYLRTHEIEADKIILMGTDPDEDMRSFEPQDTLQFVRWRNGEEPYARTFFDVPNNFPYRDRLQDVKCNLESILIHHSKRRFSKLLADKDLSDLIFYHARLEEANRRVSKDELDFLERKGVLTREVYGDHHSTILSLF